MTKLIWKKLTNTMIRRYSELILLPTFKERFDYLNLNGRVGEPLFGYGRFLNQTFYHSPEWKKVRRRIIIRDNGCDLGLDDYRIGGNVYVHHMNPITIDDLENNREKLLDPEYLICCSYDTHQAITYGAESLLPRGPIVRKPNDMCPWK